MNHLQRLPLVGKSRLWPKNPINCNFRYNWRAQASHALRWNLRTTFLDHIDDLIHELWPDDVPANERQGSRSGGCESQASPPQPGHTTQSEEKGAAGRTKKKRSAVPEPRGQPTNARLGAGSGGPAQQTIHPPAREVVSSSSNPIANRRRLSNTVSPNAPRRPRWYTKSSTDDSDKSSARTATGGATGAEFAGKNEEGTMHVDVKEEDKIDDGEQQERGLTDTSPSLRGRH